MPNRSLIVTTALTIVVFTTIFFGFFVGLISKCVKREADSKLEVVLGDDDRFLKVEDAEVTHAVNDNLSDYQALEHPNMAESEKGESN